MIGNSAAQNVFGNDTYGMSTQGAQGQLANTSTAMAINAVAHQATLANNSALSQALAPKAVDPTRMSLTLSQIVNGYIIDYTDTKSTPRKVFCKDLVDVGTQVVGIYAARQMEE
jgi:hypothetical protein